LPAANGHPVVDRHASGLRSPGLLGYSSVHFGKSLLWAGEDALTLYVLVRFLELPPALAGIMFLASALWNALCDGLFGAALHRWPLLSGSLPFISAIGILTAGLAFAALPLVATGEATVAISLLFLFRTGFSLADLPHNALTRELAGTRGDLGVARLRAIGSSAAAIVIGLAALPVLLAGDAGQAFAAVLIGCVGYVAILFMLPLPFLLAREGGAIGHGERVSPHGVGPRGLWLYCAATAVGLAGLAAAGKAMLHLDFGAPGIAAAVVLILTTGRLAAVWLWTPIARRIGNHRALALAYAVTGLTTPLIPTLAGLEAPATLLCLFLISLPGGGIAMLSWAVLSAIIGKQEAVRTPGQYAAAFGLFTMSMKIGLGASAAIAGFWLSSNGVSVDIDPATFWSLASAAMLACWAAAGVILIIGDMSSGTASGNRVSLPQLREVGEP